MSSFAARDEIRCSLVCPKPRRIGHLCSTPDPLCPLRWQPCDRLDPLDLTSGVDLVDMFLTKENPMNSTPPFQFGSPPIRSANPMVNDARFSEAVQVNEIWSNPNSINFASPVPVSASARAGCARTKLGFTPAAVRIEGFDCLDRDRNRSRGIPAVA